MNSYNNVQSESYATQVLGQPKWLWIQSESDVGPTYSVQLRTVQSVCVRVQWVCTMTSLGIVSIQSTATKPHGRSFQGESQG